ncbi:exodeoxyribonuclease V subunit gamma [Spirochaetota bacterium]
MGIIFHFTNTIEKLTDLLIENISGHRDADPFSAPMVLVPNVNVKKYLTLQMAERTGIAMNIDFKFLEEGLTDLLMKAIGREDTPRDYLFLSHRENHIYLHLIILSLLADPESGNDQAPLKGYLRGASDDEYASKIWQLAWKLTYLFREYEYHRYSMTEKWLSGKNIFTDDEVLILEKAQASLYRSLFQDAHMKDIFKGIMGKEYLTLPQYVKNVFPGEDTGGHRR